MLDKDQIKTLNLLNELGEVIILDTTENAFIYYFSNLDIHGVGSLMSDNHKYESYSKSKFLEFLNSCFQDLKNRKINKLKSYQGICNSCFAGQPALTFIEEKSGDYIEFVLIIDNNIVVNINFCFSIKNQINRTKGSRLEITPWTNLRI